MTGAELLFRESCRATRSGHTENNYYAHYRTLADYDSLLSKQFVVLREGSIQTYIDCFADPFQFFWHSRKN